MRRTINLLLKSTCSKGFIPLLLFCATPVNAKTFKYDFDEFKVGTAEYEKGPTGCTVFHFPKGADAAIDIRGGAAAVREASSIEELNTWGYVDAITLAGGSTFGLDVASGVMAEILKERGGKATFDTIPSVPGAIVYDFAGRDNSIYPDKELGSKAFNKAKTNQVEIGRAGAGRFVTVGKYFGRELAQASGQGAAFYQEKGIKIFGLTVLNAVGNIFNEKGEIIAGSFDKKNEKHLDVAFELMNGKKSVPPKTKENTTISIIITNADVSRTDLKRIAVMAHTGMAASIRPFHTPWDGDTLFVVSTKSVKLPDGMGVIDLGTIGAEIMNQAVRVAVEKN
ncbi:MAG: P1 family peptidase [Bacteriovoracaceae bacterium]